MGSRTFYRGVTYPPMSLVLMQQSLIPVIFFLHLLIVPTLCGMVVISEPSYTLIPDPILLHTDPDLVPKLAQDAGPVIRPLQDGNPAANTNPVLNLITARTRMDTDAPPTFVLTSNPDGSVGITATVPNSGPAALTPCCDARNQSSSSSGPAAERCRPCSVFRLRSPHDIITHCVPFAAAAPAAAHSNVSHLSALVRHLPLDAYCVQLGCSCEQQSCPRRPTDCTRHEHRAGIDMNAWRRAANVTVRRHSDTAAGPAVSVIVRQAGYRFESFNLSVHDCKVGKMTLAADQWVRLDTNCLQYNSTLHIQVFPDTWFCEGGTGGCRAILVEIGPLRRLPTRRPPVLRATPPPGWLIAALVLLGSVTVAVAAAGVLWSHRRHRKYIASLASATGCQNFAADCRAAAGERAGASVLLLHLARSDAERAAVRQLAAELRARGAVVTDSAAPEWRRAARRDADAMPAAVPAGGRVLLLSSPAAAAAVVAGGGPSEPERLLAAAVRQLAGSRLTADYGRLYQARLTADSPTVAGLVPGAVYTLPEHQHELVTALLAGTGSDINPCTGIVPAQTADTEAPAKNGVAELTV